MTQDVGFSGLFDEVKPEETKSDQNTEETKEPTAKGPWLSYVPKFIHKTPEDLYQRLDEHRNTIEEVLKMKELFKLAFLERNIHDAYYRSYVRDSNKLFKVAVLYRKRLKKILKNNT